MSRYLDEIYCSAVRNFGSHGMWEPGMWLWPGACGHYRRGVFTREGWLKPEDWGFEVLPSPSTPQIVQTEGIVDAHAAAEVSAQDPLSVLSAGVGLSYSVARANEVLVLTHPGIWWEIDDIEGLLARIRAVLAQWPLSKTVICAVFETPGGVVGISSRSTSGFTISADAGGWPAIAVQAKGGLTTGLTSQRSARRAFPLLPKGSGPTPDIDVAPEQRRNRMYTPFFAKGYRVSKRWLGRFGRKELVTLNGDPIPGRIARAEPEDLLYDPASAEMSMAEIENLPIDELFEEVTPQLLTEEVSSELASEILPEEMPGGSVSPDLLARVGIKALDVVSVPRRYRPHLDELRRRVRVIEEEEEKKKNEEGMATAE